MTTEMKGIAILVRPDVEAHTDPRRVIRRRTTCDSDEEDLDATGRSSRPACRQP